MQQQKHYIALFYIALIMVFKVAGLHAFTHHTDDGGIDHCEVCEITSITNFTPLLETEIAQVPVPEAVYIATSLTSATGTISFENKYFLDTSRTRPPPALS
ncbi:hypothetical protein [uncultured Dokdonia sp.]|uniref:hypothetical protein n=1 Tax=uncultured Dokdonia sp. TaxID=575653 RepID=UPI002615E360|nr:hypothetical protein [uncultured Dokdonia sp.]